jgi:hypothetical protein
MLGAVTLRLDNAVGGGPIVCRGIAASEGAFWILSSDGRGVDSWSAPFPVIFEVGEVSPALEVEASLAVVLVSQSSNRLSRGQ